MKANKCDFCKKFYVSDDPALIYTIYKLINIDTKQPYDICDSCNIILTTAIKKCQDNKV